MKKIYIVLMALSAHVAFAQSPTFEWVGQMGGTNEEVGNAVCTDNQGNVYTTGYFQGTCDFDPGAGTNNLTALGNSDIFVSKMDPAGNLLWVVQAGGTGSGTGSDQGVAIKMDPTGNVVITGYFKMTADFDPGPGVFNLSTGGSTDTDIFVWKLTANGTFVWAKQLGGNNADLSAGLAVDASGNILLTGYFSGTADFDPGVGVTSLVSAGSGDGFVCKLNNAGDLVWVRQFTGVNAIKGNAIAVDANGNSCTTGYFNGSVDFDPGPGTLNFTSIGSADIFVVSLDASGNLLWARQQGGASSDWGNAVDTDASGNWYIAGYFTGIADFDMVTGPMILNSNGGFDFFVMKLTSTGNLDFVKQIGGTGSENALGIDLDGFDNIYVTGHYSATADFDPGPSTYNLTSFGSIDIFLVKLDPVGNFIWAVNAGGVDVDRAYGLCVDQSNNVYTTGQFQSTCDFDPTIDVVNATSAGGFDIFLQKLSQCVETASILNVSACDFYYSPSNVYFWTASGTYIDTVQNVAGCDSIITINLTINPSYTTTIDFVDACNEYTWPVNGMTYTSSGFHVESYLSVNGCDSTEALNLTIFNLDTTVSQVDELLTANQTGASYQWIDCISNTIISGATDQQYTATQNGEYQVQITLNGCMDSSSCIVINNVGINELGGVSSILVSPNPTDGAFTIQLGEEQSEITVKIYTVSGQLVQSISEKGVSSISIDSLTTGVYLLAMTLDKGQIKIHKLIVR